jgi:phage tail P2-like protein
MPDNENILASSVNSIDHITVFDRMVQARLESIDLVPMLMYLIDVVPVAALPALAEQFDVLGFNGWALCDTEEQRRTLIKRAIELKRFRGTPWSVKEALKSVGYNDVSIQEGVSGALYDATYVHDATITYGGGNWANFRLSLLDLGESKGFSTEDLATIIEVVNKYKPARCKLLDIILSATTIDYFDEIQDSEFSINAESNLQDEFNVTHYYNDTNIFDGSWLYSADSSEFEFAENFEFEDVLNSANDSDFKIIIAPLGISIATEDEYEFITEDGNSIILETSVNYYEGE